MRIPILLAGFSLLLTACGGGTPPPESPGAPAAEEQRPPVLRYVEGIDQIAEALEAVRDEAGAQVAAVRIAEISAQLRGLEKAFEDLGPAGRAEQFAAHVQEVTRAQKRMGLAMQPLLAKPTWLEIVNEGTKNIPRLP
jgi:hypothetical protein